MSLASNAATATGHRLAEGVWRVEDADGRKVVVKHQPFGWLTEGTAYDLLEVERDVLGPAARCELSGADRAGDRPRSALHLFRVGRGAYPRRCDSGRGLRGDAAGDCGVV